MSGELSSHTREGSLRRRSGKLLPLECQPKCLRQFLSYPALAALAVIAFSSNPVSA